LFDVFAATVTAKFLVSADAGALRAEYPPINPAVATPVTARVPIVAIPRMLRLVSRVISSLM